MNAGRKPKSAALLSHKETTLANGEGLVGFPSRTTDSLGWTCFSVSVSCFQKLCLAPGSVTPFSVRYCLTFASLYFLSVKWGWEKDLPDRPLWAVNRARVEAEVQCWPGAGPPLNLFSSHSYPFPCSYLQWSDIYNWYLESNWPWQSSFLPFTLWLLKFITAEWPVSLSRGNAALLGGPEYTLVYGVVARAKCRQVLPHIVFILQFLHEK